jgi:hypothetical protein
MLGQHWTETTYVDEANYDFNTRNITNAHWSEIYRDVLLDLSASILMQIIVCLQLLKNSNAQIEILSVYAWANSGDFWRYPLSSIKPSYNIKSDGYFLPVYDDAATVYSDLLTRLNVAIQN